MSNYRVMFLRDSSNRPVGCVAIEVKRNSNTATAMYRTSVLNPQDRFNRALARQLAIGRLVENPAIVILPNDPNMHDVTHAVMRDIARDTSSPSRARRAAKHWITVNRSS